MKLPGKQLSVASATSLGACSAPDMSTGGAVGDIDTHSLGRLAGLHITCIYFICALFSKYNVLVCAGV